jgi:amino acid adenylation domain-containing protein
MVIGVLGTLKAGGVYVPLDPAYPKDRLAFMLSETETSVILTQEQYLNDLPENNAQVICVDRDWFKIQQAGDQNPDVCISAENLVYVLYTSGSTGIPKGVAMRHGAMVNLIEYEIQKSNIGPGDNILQFNSLSFDLSFNEIFWALSAGGALVIVPEEIRYDIEKLAEFICDHKVTHTIMPFIALLQTASVYKQNKSYPKDLREVLSTAEQLHITSAVRNLFLQIPNCTLQNQYGPTETHVVTVLQMGSSACDWSDRPSIGKPINNTQCFILDQHLQPVPIGITGDLYIGGTGLARGYFNRPAITAENFIPNPFAIEPGSRLYKTGDLARFHIDGSLEFLGRVDNQVKIRGYRIELGEIEAILSKASGVKETVVISQGDSLGNEKLVAYIVAKFQHKPPIEDLRAQIKRSLPDYMVPSQFVFLEALPLTPSGKIDRRSLPAPDQARPELESSYAAPESVIEDALAGIWADVLGIEQVGVNDNFFELGGHSLLATMVVSRLRYVFKLDISLITIFQGPTIAELSNALLAQEMNPGEIYDISSYIVSSRNSST